MFRHYYVQGVDATLDSGVTVWESSGERPCTGPFEVEFVPLAALPADGEGLLTRCRSLLARLRLAAGKEGEMTWRT